MKNLKISFPWNYFLRYLMYTNILSIYITFLKLIAIKIPNSLYQLNYKIYYCIFSANDYVKFKTGFWKIWLFHFLMDYGSVKIANNWYYL